MLASNKRLKLTAPSVALLCFSLAKSAPSARSLSVALDGQKSTGLMDTVVIAFFINRLYGLLC